MGRRFWDIQTWSSDRSFKSNNIYYDIRSLRLCSSKLWTKLVRSDFQNKVRHFYFFHATGTVARNENSSAGQGIAKCIQAGLDFIKYFSYQTWYGQTNKALTQQFNFDHPWLLHHRPMYSAKNEFPMNSNFPSRVNMYIKRPQPIGTASYFVLPFSRDLWLCLMSSVIVITFLAITFHACLKHQMIENEIRLIDSSFWPIETFCNQSK